MEKSSRISFRQCGLFFVYLPNMNSVEKLTERSREVARIRTIESLLHWDQQTYQPPSAMEYRASQCEWLSATAHRLWTAPEVGGWIADALAADDGADERLSGSLREWKRRHDRATRLPERLVAEQTRVASLAHEAWLHARRQSDFGAFCPHLEKLLELSFEQAECLGYEECRYDALLEDYEPGARTKEITGVFDALAPRLSQLILEGEAVSGCGGIPEVLYPVEKQQALNREIAEAVGFDFSSGRVDTAPHPFCTTLGPRDIRLTTRYDERDFTSSLFGVLHEAGHGLYEQGVAGSGFGTPAGEAVSLGIHESQSRLWENHVGRSLAFWEFWLPRAAKYFPELTGVSPADLFLHVNRVRRSYIRVEADDTTYDLHILLRFRVESALFSGDLRVRDIPLFWKEQFRELFQLDVPDDANGCLQDIHWSGGSFGYFPTYTLGNLNAAQLFHHATAQHPELKTRLACGEYSGLLGWLSENVFASGATLSPKELMLRATGRPTEGRDHLESLHAKIAESSRLGEAV